MCERVRQATLTAAFGSKHRGPPCSAGRVPGRTASDRACLAEHFVPSWSRSSFSEGLGDRWHALRIRRAVTHLPGNRSVGRGQPNGRDDSERIPGARGRRITVRPDPTSGFSHATASESPGTRAARATGGGVAAPGATLAAAGKVPASHGGPARSLRHKRARRGPVDSVRGRLRAGTPTRRGGASLGAGALAAPALSRPSASQGHRGPARLAPRPGRLDPSRLAVGVAAVRRPRPARLSPSGSCDGRAGGQRWAALPETCIAVRCTDCRGSCRGAHPDRAAPAWFARPLPARERALVSALHAGLAQLVEHKLPKLGVASSNLVSRSGNATRTTVRVGGETGSTLD